MNFNKLKYCCLKYGFWILLISSCGKKEVNIQNLKGYWQIEKAIAPNGEEKEYRFSEFLEFFKMTSDTTGYRAKVKAKSFDGTFEGNAVKQHFLVINKSGKSILQYNLGNAIWEEVLVKASNKQIVVIHENGVRYFYKNYSPILINE